MNQGVTGKENDVSTRAEPSSLVFPPFRLDPQREQLWRESELIALKPKAFAILRYLVDRPHRLITKGELLGSLWGDVHVNDAVLKTHLRDIRVALGDEVKSPRYIETAPRRGYRFIAAVSRERVVRELPAAVTALDGVPHFVGREAELERLSAAWSEASSGRRQLVLVSGPPGIGKTSLVRTFLAPLARDGALVAWGQCVAQHGSGEAYLAVLEALSRLGRGAEGPRLLTAFSRRAPSWVARLPVLRELGDAPGHDGAPVAALPESIMRELAEALEHLTQEQPLLLLIEDAHSADPSTVAWLSYWARRTDLARVLVLCTYRPVEAGEAPPLLPTLRELYRLAHCSDLSLSELSRAEVESYFEARFAGLRLPPALIQLVNERVGGNPLFLVRAVDSWIEQGLLRRAAEGWELTVEIERIASSTPDSVLSLIEREYEVLGSFERSVLEAASVAGRAFSVASVAAALSEDVVRVEALCLRWARRGQFFLRLGNESWPDGTVATLFEFIHALYQEVGYRDVGVARQAQLHRRIAERLEAAYGERAHQVAGALALHFERGQDFERAVHYLGSAGEQSYTGGAYREAAGHFGRALSLLRQLPRGVAREEATDGQRVGIELSLELGFGTAMALTRGYGVPEALAAFTRAKELCDPRAPTPELFQAMVGLGAYHIVNGGYDAAKLMADELSCVCEMRPNPAARAQACLMAGVSKLFKGELGAARAYLEQALALHDPEQPRPPRALMDTGVAAQSFRGLTLWLLGEPALAADAVTQALALGARQSVLHAECMAMTWASLVFGLCGDLEESRKQAERGMKLSAQYDLALCEQTVKLHWGAVCIAQGELELGIGVIGEALAAAESSGARLGSSAWHWMLAEAHAASGRVDEALLQLGHAFSRVRAAGERWWEPELYRALGTILLASSNAELPNECQAALAGGVASAEWCFARALDLSLGMRAHALELRARHSLALSVRARASARLEDEG